MLLNAEHQYNRGDRQQAPFLFGGNFDFSEMNMFDWQRLFYDAFIYGLALSLVLTILLAVSGAIALDMFVDN